MLPAQNSGVGGNTGFPDTCNTPIPVGTSPITYPNYSTDATSVPSAINTLVGALPALHQMSKAAMTNGMQAGVAHPLYMGMGGYSSGNVKIFMKGMPAESLAMVANGNNFNCSSDATLIPSITTTLFCCKPDGTGEAGTPDHAEHAVDQWNRPLTASDIAAVLDDRPEVTGECIGHTAVIRLSLFHDDTPRQLIIELERLERLGTVAAIELDLRDNPGGSLDAAVRAADLFLPAGTALIGLRDSDMPNMPARLLRARDAMCIDHPLTLRVNNGTASAAEAFAAALVDNGRVTVNGEPTFGKGAVQAIISGKWQTVGEIERIDARTIEGSGIALLAQRSGRCIEAEPLAPSARRATSR